MKKPFLRCTVQAATNISETNAAAAKGVKKPRARKIPAPSSTEAAIRAFNRPGRMPMLSNQPAVPVSPPGPKNFL